MTREEYFDRNWNKIREWFEEQLIEQWYSRISAKESDDWWDEYVEQEKQYFIHNQKQKHEWII